MVYNDFKFLKETKPVLKRSPFIQANQHYQCEQMLPIHVVGNGSGDLPEDPDDTNTYKPLLGNKSTTHKTDISTDRKQFPQYKKMDKVFNPILKA